MTLLLGDARLLLPERCDGPAVVITDPVWPNAPAGMFPGVNDAAGILREVLERCSWARRVVIVLGCMSDPRFLAAVPEHWPFVRTCWLRHAVPSYRGTVLNSADVAYVFGDHVPQRPRRVFGGEVTQHAPTSIRQEAGGEHPSPRRLDHMLWLVDTFASSDDLVVDPFAGGGTTLVAAARLSRRFLGIEIEPRFHALAEERLRAEARGHSLASERAGQEVLFARAEGSQ